MSPVLAKQAFDAILALKKSISDNNLSSTPPVKKDYNYEITVQNGTEKCKILIYFGKKGLKTILQGNEYSNLYKTVDSIVFNKFLIIPPENELDEPAEYIGTDESGKGDIFGPLVIAAVYIDNKTRNELLRIGVKDSKEIKNGKIQTIAAGIRDIIGDNYTILELAPPLYNNLYSKYLNLNKFLDYGHSQVIEALLKKTDSPAIITDQFCKNALTISKNPVFSNKNFIQLPKGEKYTAVAAASILARDRFEAWFTDQEEAGLYLPKGASSDVEARAKEILHTLGKESLLKVSKNHFKPIKNLIL